MPPKVKSKKPAKARTPTLIDGLTKEEISKEQMQEHIVHLREELDREREERNYFQLERDTVHKFWKINERQLEVLTAEQNKLDKDIEDDEGRHQVEIKVYKQKMKHLLCEHQNTILELKADGLDTSRAMQIEQEKLERELHKEKYSIMLDKQELDIQVLVEQLKLKHDEEMTEARNAWEKQLTEIKGKYEEKLELLSQDLENMRRSEISERADHWNTHITALVDDHSKTIGEANANLHLIQEDVDVADSLKKQIKYMSVKQKEKETGLAAILQENKILAERVKNVKEENTGIEKKINRYTLKKDTSKNVDKKKLRTLESYYEALKMKFSKMQQERDELYKTFTQTIQSVQDKEDKKSVLLERKLKALTDMLEKTQLDPVLSASSMDPTAGSQVKFRKFCTPN
ncbi:dynein regulatory complex subunit 4 isoform X2 [Brachionichthys hirsutus]|uniref:dynein regulatory complex subunit 4 isoform X2 n=1 Tax=Brachionichthys hirsutus TaxID=412623 RepID=UPI003604B412